MLRNGVTQNRSSEYSTIGIRPVCTAVRFRSQEPPLLRNQGLAFWIFAQKDSFIPESGLNKDRVFSKSDQWSWAKSPVSIDRKLTVRLPRICLHTFVAAKPSAGFCDVDLIPGVGVARARVLHVGSRWVVRIARDERGAPSCICMVGWEVACVCVCVCVWCAGCCA